jgi:hypothetical protein
MSIMRKVGGLGAALAIALGLLVASVSAVSAQGPYTAYGIGQSDGDVIEASIGGVSCSSTTANADGEWVLRVDQSDACNPNEGDTINFSLNGDSAEETATWTAGGTPATSGYDADIGIPLTAGTPSDGGDAPGPSDTGNAGIVTTSGAASSVLVLLLGVFAATMVAGARVATRTR